MIPRLWTMAILALAVAIPQQVKADDFELIQEARRKLREAESLYQGGLLAWEHTSERAVQQAEVMHMLVDWAVSPNRPEPLTVEELEWVVTHAEIVTASIEGVTLDLANAVFHFGLAEGKYTQADSWYGMGQYQQSITASKKSIEYSFTGTDSLSDAAQVLDANIAKIEAIAAITGTPPTDPPTP